MTGTRIGKRAFPCRVAGEVAINREIPMFHPRPKTLITPYRSWGTLYSIQHSGETHSLGRSGAARGTKVISGALVDGEQDEQGLGTPHRRIHDDGGPFVSPRTGGSC